MSSINIINNYTNNNIKRKKISNILLNTNLNRSLSKKLLKMNILTNIKINDDNIITKFSFFENKIKIKKIFLNEPKYFNK